MSPFRNLALQAFLGVCMMGAPGCVKPVIILQDCVVAPDGRTIIVADLKKETILGFPKDVAHQPIRFLAGGKELGHVTCDEDGLAPLECKLPDEQVAAIEATATVDGVEVRTAARVFRWKTDRVVVVIDIDDTISDTDLHDVVFEKKDYDSKPLRYSRATLQDLAGKYELLYLTARPSILLDKTRRWLAMRGFPEAPVIVSHRKRDLLRQEKYKERVLERFQRIWPNILIGIGNKDTDAHAYGAAGMLSLIVTRKDGNFGRHTLWMSDWRTLHDFFEGNQPILTNPELCRQAIAGRRPLLQTVKPYRENDD